VVWADRDLIQSTHIILWLSIPYLAGGNALGGATVRLGDVVLDVLPADAPHTAAAHLEGAKLPCLDQRVNLVRFHVELFGRLGGRHERCVLGSSVTAPSYVWQLYRPWEIAAARWPCLGFDDLGASACRRNTPPSRIGYRRKHWG
jgi:hypothetical protein